MSAPTTTRTSSQDSTDSLRKRVCKACDRCRLKKSKCDGSSPCSRCKADNSICVFGERKKTHDKVYPKGYVEMLEQQQAQLVAGLQDMYRKLSAAHLWHGPALEEPDGHPLTHDILAALSIISTSPDGQVDEMFEDDPERMQERLFSQGAAMTTRRGSVSTASERSHAPGHERSKSHPQLQTSSPSRHQFPENFGFHQTSTSPVSRSPASHAPAQPHLIKPSPLHTESPIAPLDDLDWPDYNLNFDANFDANLDDDFGSFPDQKFQPDPNFELRMPIKKQFMVPSFDAWSFDQRMVQPYNGSSFTHVNEPHIWQPDNMDYDMNGYVPVST